MHGRRKVRLLGVSASGLAGPAQMPLFAAAPASRSDVARDLVEQRFGEGTLRVGTSLTFHMGVDPVPTVKICHPTGDQADVLAQTIADIGSGKINTGTVTGLDDYNGYVPNP